MSLNLDARQRAMLQEMGVTVWTRAETAAPQSPAAMQPVTVGVPATAPLPAAPAMAQPPAGSMVADPDAKRRFWNDLKAIMVKLGWREA